MDLHNRDHIRIANKIRYEPILNLSRALGTYTPQASDFGDDALFQKRMHELWYYYSGSTTPVIYKDRLIGIGDIRGTDSTLMIVDPDDLVLKFDYTKLLTRCRNTTFVRLKPTGKLFRSGLPETKTIKNGFVSYKPLNVTDRCVHGWLTLNTTIDEFWIDLVSDFEILKPLVAAELERLKDVKPRQKGEKRKTWSSSKTLTKALCVTTKADGKTLEWRLKQDYFDKIMGINSFNACADLIR